MNTRLLGTLGMLGAPMLLLGGLLYGSEANQATAPFNLLFLGGWMCSLLGLRALNATGDRVPGKAILVAQLIGLVLGAVFEIMHIMDPNPDSASILFQVTDAAWPLSVTFMIVVGIAALLAKVLPGWQRFTPLLCGLTLPIAMIAGIVAGRPATAIIFAIYTAVVWMALGYAVRAAGRTIVSTYAVGTS